MHINPTRASSRTALACFLTTFFLIVITVNAQQSFSFVQLCDPQLGMGGYEHDSLALCQAVQQINDISPDFVVICGDLVHEANDTSYGDFKFILSGLHAPYYAAPGNHDVENSPTNESLAYYRNTIGPDYYTMDYLNHTFVFVNSTLWMAPLEGEAEKQDEWLHEVMAKLKEEQRNVFVIGHHPLFLKTPEEQDVSSVIPPEKRAELLSLFSEAGVKAYLTGHTHMTVLNNFNGMMLVCGETTSLNFDDRPLGFRLWQVNESAFSHGFVMLDEHIEEEMEPVEQELQPVEEGL
ncbi:MAG: metallophosphoesterase [Bacteroidales bacterium]|nr:metallophosphoesterase [Bacteroidales bacterium]